MSGSITFILLAAIIALALWQFFKSGTGPILFIKEFRSFFLSPVAWVVLALVMLLNGFSFTAALTDLREGDRSVTLAVYAFNSTQFWLAYFFIFPVITMRLFAEEQKLGTIETLLTAPVTTVQVLLSKYFAALSFYILLWLPSMLNFLVFRISAPDSVSTIGSLQGSYSIIFLVGVFNIAIGCLASALTKNQLVAAMICFTFCLLHFLVGYVMEYLPIPDDFRSFVDYFSTLLHVRTFIDGLIDTRPIVYYLSFAILLLTTTFHVLEFRKWKV
jgi:ABC-2 type transport system permease protein